MYSDFIDVYYNVYYNVYRNVYRTKTTKVTH
jgi:hypothetical protein